MGLGIFIVCLVLSIVYGYFGFVRPDPSWHGVNSRNRFASVTLALISLVGLYIFLADRGVPEDLGRYISPYPGATGTYVPPTGDSMQWLLHTEASPQEVLDFYRGEENRPGWSVKTEEQGLLQFERDGMILTIFATRMAGETSISYSITTRRE